MMNISSVMIVDDSECDQFIAKKIIKKYDSEIKISSAGDGQEALDILERENPDIIFLDINMPRMDGHEFLAAYNERATANTTIMCMLTSSDQEEDKIRAFKYDNVKGYLLKPISKLDLEKISSGDFNKDED